MVIGDDYLYFRICLMLEVLDKSQCHFDCAVMSDDGTNAAEVSAFQGLHPAFPAQESSAF